MTKDMDSTSIIPALMAERFSDIERGVDTAIAFATWVQLDVMDGVFVPSTSWPYGNEQWQEVEQLAQGTRTLPQKGKIHYEAHLMVSDPERVGELLARGGVERIIMHVETLEGIDMAHMCSAWRAAGASEIGIAILLGTPISALEVYREYVQSIQVMGIERVGFQGEEMDLHATERIALVRNAYPDMPIAFDGGANMKTIAALVAAGASRIVAGSAIFDATDPRTAYDGLVHNALHNESR